MKSHILLAFAVVASASLLAQSLPENRRQEFEAATIKLHPGIGNVVDIRLLPGGRLVAENCSLRFLMQFAFGIQNSRIVGGPDWLNTARYDVQAKAEAGTTDEPTIKAMLGALLADRFRLVLHRDTRQISVYELTLREGRKLNPSSPGGCVRSDDLGQSSVPAQGDRLPVCGFHGFGIEGFNRNLDMAGVTMGELSGILSRELRAPVVDKTGLGARVFDIGLTWAEEPTAAGADGQFSPANSSDRPSLFAALTDQAGLKLVFTKGPEEVLMIDHVEKPSDN